MMIKGYSVWYVMKKKCASIFELFFRETKKKEARNLTMQEKNMPLKKKKNMSTFLAGNFKMKKIHKLKF